MAVADPRHLQLIRMIRASDTTEKKRKVMRKRLEYYQKVKRVEDEPVVEDIPEGFVGPPERLSTKDDLSQSEMSRLSTWYRERSEVELSRQRARQGMIDPGGWYRQSDIIPGYHGYVKGSDIIKGYTGWEGTEDVIESYKKDIIPTQVSIERDVKRSPYYTRFKRTDEGYMVYEDPMLKEQYEKIQWEKLPLVSKIARPVIGAVLYSPKFLMDVGWGYATGPSVPGGRFIGAYKAGETSFIEGKAWESYNWQLRLQDKYDELAVRMFTSPLAVTAYTYGVFSLGRGVYGVLKPKIMDKFSTALSKAGGYVPSKIRFYYGRVRGFPGKFADVRLAKQMYRSYQYPGWPSFVTSKTGAYGKYYLRGSVLSSGRYAESGFYQRMFTGLETRMYAPVYGTPSRFALFQEHLAERNLNRIRRSMMKGYPFVESKTFVTVHPYKPWMGMFLTETKGGGFSIGTITMGKKTFVSGKTFWKLSPDNVFYQKAPFKSIISGKEIGDIGGFTYYSSKGVTLSGPSEKVFSRLYGHTFRRVDTGLFGPRLSYNIGLSSMRTTYAGEMIIKKGFLEQMKFTERTVFSQGYYADRFGSGMYRDYTRIVHPVIKKQLSLGEGFGTRFAYDSPGLTILDDLRLPGGMGMGSVKMSYPKMFPSMGGFARMGVRSSTSMGSVDDVVSSFWKGISPSFKKSSVQSLFNVSLPKSFSGVFSLSFVGSGFKSIQGVSSDVKNISLVDTQLKQLQNLKLKQLSMLKQLQIQETVSIGSIPHRGTGIVPIGPIGKLPGGNGFPPPPKYSIASIPSSPPIGLFDESYKKRLRSMHLPGLFGKGWRKRVWFKKGLDVI